MNVTKSQAVQAYKKLSHEDAKIIDAGVRKLQERTKLSRAECLTVFASAGLYLIQHE